MDKNELLEQVKSLYDKDAYAGIIDLLSPLVSELDFDLNLELSRAYINLGNSIAAGTANTFTSEKDAESCYLQANALLDKYAIQGRDHSTYLFYKGYALFKLGLINDACIRFERAQRFIRFGSDDHLMGTLNHMINLCKSLDPDNHDFKMSAEDDKLLDEHIKKNFGSYRILFKTERYELLHIPPAPDEGRNFNLIMTKGLSGRKINVPDDVDAKDNSRLELCVCLPHEWEFTNSEGYNLWPINTLCELVNFVLTTGEFVGFGYTFSNGKPLHSSTSFNGGMLTAIGGYATDVQEMRLSDESLVHFFELIFLYPMEVAFRQQHSAAELLERFRAQQVLPSPLRKRPDVCISPNEIKGIVQKI